MPQVPHTIMPDQHAWLYKNQLAFTYATLVSTTEYAIGVQLLMCSLNRFHGQPYAIPLTIVWDVDGASQLSKRTVQGLASRLDMHTSFLDVQNPAQSTEAAMHARKGTYTKFHIWRLPYLYVAYLDSDILVQSNPAGLFYALATGGELAYCGRKGGYFNSGVMTLRPDSNTFDELVHLIHKGGRFTTDPTEQDLLIQLFRARQTVVLPDLYNIRPLHARKQPNDMALVHAIGNPKPWTRILRPGTSTVRNQTFSGSSFAQEWSDQLWREELHHMMRGECSRSDSPKNESGM